jgi:putative ATP-binding cassette transporter
VNNLSDMSQLAAQTDRLDALLGALAAQAERLPGGVQRKPSKDGGVLLHELTLTTPRGEQTLCKGLSLALAPGQSLLIVGPSGVGKTSIMRAVAGEAAQPGAGEGSPWGAISSTSATTEAQRAWQPGAEQAR